MARVDWNDFQIFLGVARAGRISVAGRQLGLDHATVGRRISCLETALKSQLFKRSPRGYELTEQGERLLASVENMESAVFGAQAAVGEADLQLSGSVRIGAPDGFGSAWLSPRLVPFLRQHAGLEVQIVAIPRGFNLTKREADIAIVLSPPQSGRLVARRLVDYTLHIYASRSYLAERAAPQTRDDLRRHSGVGYIQEMVYAPELDYLSEIAPGLRPRMTSSTLMAQLHATLAGAGICVLPDFLARDFETLVPLLETKVELKRSFWLVLHEDTRNLARIRTIADFITASIHADAALFTPLRADG